MLSCTPIIMVKFEVKAVFQMELHTNQEKEGTNKSKLKYLRD